MGKIVPGAWLALALLGAGACEPQVNMNERVFKRDPDGFRVQSLACYLLSEGSGWAGSSSGGSSLGGGADDFSQNTTAEHGVLTVEARSDDRLLFRRQYDTAFARSGRVDEFTVMTNKGDEYRFRYWGSDDCQAGGPTDPTPEPSPP